MIAGMAINGCEQVHILGAEMPIMRNAASRSRGMVKLTMASLANWIGIIA
jgi:hypothetical protein